MIPHEHVFFGPYLAKFNIDQEFSNRMLKQGKKLKISHATNLAGKIKTELLYDTKNDPWVLEGYYPFINSWIEGYEKTSGEKLSIQGVSAQYIWINFQKKNEMNPMHTHTNCDLSFVHWIKIPKAIINEGKKDITKSNRPGGISFFYGEEQDLVRTIRDFIPADDVLMVFPSKLRHEVMPFKSNVTRISVAGNIKFHYGSS